MPAAGDAWGEWLDALFSLSACDGGHFGCRVAMEPVSSALAQIKLMT
jgi:hypothetical protein